MAALTLAIDNAATSTRQTIGVPTERMLASGVPRVVDAAPQSSEDGDFLIYMLSRVQAIIERIVAERHAANTDRIRVETRRQLAKLPTWVRNDLFHPEQNMIAPWASLFLVERQPITLLDGKHQTYSFD